MTYVMDSVPSTYSAYGKVFTVNKMLKKSGALNAFWMHCTRNLTIDL